MPLRFQNVCRHRQTNNTDHFPPPLTPPHVVSSPFRRASFKLALPFPKIPGRPFPATPHRTRCFLAFPAPLLSNLPYLSRKSSAGRFPPILTPHTLFPHLSCRASFKLSRLSRKSPAGLFPPPRTAHVVFSLSSPASFKLALPFPKIPCRPFSAAPHPAARCFLPFPAPLLSNFPSFPENLLPAVFRRSSHRTRCFLAFRSCSPLPCLTFSYHHFKSSPSPSPHNSFLNLSQHSK